MKMTDKTTKDDDRPCRQQFDIIVFQKKYEKIIKEFEISDKNYTPDMIEYNLREFSKEELIDFIKFLFSKTR